MNKIRASCHQKEKKVKGGKNEGKDVVKTKRDKKK
jgi:hypothetical protein